MDNFFIRKGFWKREVATCSPTPAEVPETTNKGASYAENAVMVNNMRSALNIPAFARAIVVISNTMSQCEMQYQRYIKATNCYVMDDRNQGMADGKYINYLCHIRPNPKMAWSNFIRQAIQDIYLKGNAYIFIDRHLDSLNALWLCSSGTYDEYSNTYNLVYDSRKAILAKAADVIHLKSDFSRDNGMTGISILEYAYTTLSIAATNDQQTLENSAKGGKMKLLLQETPQTSFGLGRAAKKELEKITNDLNKNIYSQDVMLLSNVAQVTPISQSADKMQLIESRKFSVRDVARITGVPPILLMDDSNSSYNTPEAATRELMRTIAPIVRQIEEEFNEKLVGYLGYGTFRYHYCTDSLMRLDPAGRATLGKTLLETGVKSVNELRADYDMSIIEGGDLHYLSTNLAELGSAKLNGNLPTTEGGQQ